MKRAAGDYHVHSTFSDGRDGLRELAESALALGMSGIGFSDHCYTPHDTSYCMPASRLDDYIAECRVLRDEYRGRLDILCGLAQEYFGGRADSRHDYVIGSVHYLPAGDVPLAIDEGADELTSLTERYYGGDILSAAECYFSLVAEVGTVTGAGIVGHFDLITKYIERGIALDTSSPRYRSAWQSAADRLISEGLIFEINTGAISRGYRSSPYPSEEMVEYIAAHGGRFILSSDSHRTDTLCYGFEECRDAFCARYGERSRELLLESPLS